MLGGWALCLKLSPSQPQCGRSDLTAVESETEQSSEHLCGGAGGDSIAIRTMLACTLCEFTLIRPLRAALKSIIERNRFAFVQVATGGREGRS